MVVTERPKDFTLQSREFALLIQSFCEMLHAFPLVIAVYLHIRIHIYIYSIYLYTNIHGYDSKSLCPQMAGSTNTNNSDCFLQYSQVSP